MVQKREYKCTLLLAGKGGMVEYDESREVRESDEELCKLIGRDILTVAQDMATDDIIINVTLEAI